MVHIAVLIMVKNEKKRIHVTLDSVKNFADSIVIFDTGSTDNTLDICRDFSKKNNIPVRIKEGTFVNFEVSRNESLDFADSFEDIDYILLLDVNDELRGGKELRKIVEDNPIISAFLLCQEWWSGFLNKYYNVRLIKSKRQWRYVGVVHEYINNFSSVEENKSIFRVTECVVLYQDRTKDDDKSSKRFSRDKELLLDSYKKDSANCRTIFYLAQTLSCLNENDLSFYYYKLRSELDDFYEEKYYSFFKCGDLAQTLKHDWSDCMKWYLKAFDIIKRAEPLCSIAEYYYKNKKWELAYTFINMACKLKFPDQCILFVDRLCYDYKRWHLFGIVAYYVGSYEKGKDALYKAIENGKKNNVDVSIDKKNIKFYYEKEKEKEEKEEKEEITNETLDIKNKLKNIIKNKEIQRKNKNT